MQKIGIASLVLRNSISIRVPELRAHTAPCANCPSAHFEPDPESQDIKAWPHSERVKTAFPCGWNGKRFCKGYCDQMGISDSDLVAAANDLLG